MLLHINSSASLSLNKLNLLCHILLLILSASNVLVDFINFDHRSLLNSVKNISYFFSLSFPCAVLSIPCLNPEFSIGNNYHVLQNGIFCFMLLLFKFTVTTAICLDINIYPIYLPFTFSSSSFLKR